MNDAPWIGQHPLDYEESLQPVDFDIDLEYKTELEQQLQEGKQDD